MAEDPRGRVREGDEGETFLMPLADFAGEVTANLAGGRGSLRARGRSCGTRFGLCQGDNASRRVFARKVGKHVGEGTTLKGRVIQAGFQVKDGSRGTAKGVDEKTRGDKSHWAQKRGEGGLVKGVDSTGIEPKSARGLGRENFLDFRRDGGGAGGCFKDKVNGIA